MRDVILVLLMSTSLIPCCEIKENVNKSNSNPDNQETREIETSFMVLMPSGGSASMPLLELSKK
jgi:hypothetical protein